MLKAQLFQESRLDPGVCSAVGACGIAQFMGGTWSEVTTALRYPAGSSRFDARLAIDAAAYYQGKLRRSWREPGRSGDDRNDLGAASYNAGIGNILKSQKVCGDAVIWRDIERCLPQITGRHAAETQGYVRSIHKWRSMMEAD